MGYTRTYASVHQAADRNQMVERKYTRSLLSAETTGLTIMNQMAEIKPADVYAVRGGGECEHAGYHSWEDANCGLGMGSCEEDQSFRKSKQENVDSGEDTSAVPN